MTADHKTAVKSHMRISECKWDPVCMWSEQTCWWGRRAGSKMH